MKRIIISVIAAIALLAAATSMLRSHAGSVDRSVATAGKTSSPIAGAADVSKLAVEDFDDQSLVFSKTSR